MWITKPSSLAAEPSCGSSGLNAITIPAALVCRAPRQVNTCAPATLHHGTAPAFTAFLASAIAGGRAEVKEAYPTGLAIWRDFRGSDRDGEAGDGFQEFFLLVVQV